MDRHCFDHHSEVVSCDTRLLFLFEVGVLNRNFFIVYLYIVVKCYGNFELGVALVLGAASKINK